MAISKADLEEFRKHFTEHFNADLDLLISKVDPVPIPDQGPKIRYAIHKYDNDTPTNVSTMDVYDLQRGYTVSGTPKVGSELYIYASMARSPKDPNGYIQFLAPNLTVADGMLCHVTTGGYVQRLGTSGAVDDVQTLINIKNAAWQQAAISAIVNACRNVSATGLYLDEIDQTLTWAWPTGGQCKEFPSDAAWRAALHDWILMLANSLHAHGLKLWINLGADGTTSAWQQSLFTLVDAVNIEFFTGREGVGQAPTNVDDYWPFQTTLVDTIERGYGKPVHVHCSSMKTTVVDYAFLTWLMCTQFLGSFTASVDYGGTWMPPGSGLAVAAGKLGRPTGQLGTASTGYVRSFEHGSVFVNPFTTAKAGLMPQTGRIVINA